MHIILTQSDSAPLELYGKKGKRICMSLLNGVSLEHAYCPLSICGI